jgi:hypothetical protein
VSRSPLAVAILAAVVLGGAYIAVQRSGVDDAAALGPTDLAALGRLDTQLAALEADVAAMAAYEGVWENELQYTRGLDRHDERLIRDSFWADAQASYGTLVEIEGLARWANDSHANSAAHQHHVTGLSLDVDGATAHEEGYILYSSDLPRDKTLDTAGVPTPGRAAAGSFATLGTGRYVNRYERRDGDWRMIVHEYVHDVSLRLEAADLCATGCIGRWDASDISYLRPLQPLAAEERRRRAEESTMPHATPAAAGRAER